MFTKWKTTLLYLNLSGQKKFQQVRFGASLVKQCFKTKPYHPFSGKLQQSYVGKLGHNQCFFLFFIFFLIFFWEATRSLCTRTCDSGSSLTLVLWSSNTQPYTDIWLPTKQTHKHTHTRTGLTGVISGVVTPEEKIVTTQTQTKLERRQEH